MFFFIKVILVITFPILSYFYGKLVTWSRGIGKKSDGSFRFDLNNFKKLFGAEKSFNVLSNIHQSNLEIPVEEVKIKLSNGNIVKKTQEPTTQKYTASETLKTTPRVIDIIYLSI